jgi:SAM-dependent methyltransferase
MNRALRIIRKILNFFGLNPGILISNLGGIRFYFSDLRRLRKQRGGDRRFPIGINNPVLNERFSEAGEMNRHYFYQDLHVARLILKNKPKKHLDIGSRIDGFASHVAVFRDIEIMDIRDLKIKADNIEFRQADLMVLPDDMIDYCDSISSLHVIEHFGLGRYGDPVDYYGHEKAIRNITEILQRGGIFYFSVPIGPQRIEFNAHRVFSLEYLMELLNEDFTIKSFSYVDDTEKFNEDVELEDDAISSNFGCNFGCGIFELVKK